MSSADNKRTVIVGIFTFLAIVILVAGIFMLAGQQKRLISTVTLTAIFDDVAGLRTGNNVWFSGVKIGTIKSINLYGDSQVEVVMNIEEKVQQYIRKNATARISSESFIGNKNIVIDGGTQSAAPIEDGDRITAVSPLNTDDLMEKLQQNNENLVAITGDFKQLTSRLVKGEGTVGALLTDTTMAQDFRNVVANLQRTTQSTVTASNSLSAFTSKLNSPGGLANQLATDKEVFQQLKNSMTQLEEATASTSEITENLRTASSRLNNSNNAVGVLLNDPKFARQLQSTMQNLETGTEKLDQNMEALQSNFLLRGFFRKQAKEQARQQQNQPAQQPVQPTDTIQFKPSILQKN
ncbi:MlaD family protein [Pontibacter ramchanderi]|uniref:Phospholipid/cholesterol/gamma-HCH transport system substrate-binding protein n=1 Tax=Pontibacter ramchanderi TaxID=1179743 RepID=A0A2N3V2K6_9BACT|nr:MlaD family protein [Pontibacter ramchanderi]PKV75833.1 phospholipid/cholesterol/gamma-HCH transport system substrate-binding protein [Pontibacter ramchanderi]